ncbi:hypothetical protein [Anaerobaca lacustris]|uniref:Uncharacterized protein n=1 Tax=Anaerobaca lacustris TaxID=3044600 RepID=A0AAW6TRL6_9BACT|nr:hypothetical protein [Sedimentisphaerales bacterium M17dextr]
MDWERIWTFFFFLSLGVFTALAVIVTIGGFFDIRSLFKDLSKAREQQRRASD